MQKGNRLSKEKIYTPTEVDNSLSIKEDSTEHDNNMSEKKSTAMEIADSFSNKKEEGNSAPKNEPTTINNSQFIKEDAT